jgi:hypothetical protein
VITDDTKPLIVGLVKIIDFDTGEVLLDKRNAINAEALSYALALSLADRPNGSIQQMIFGNGASTVSANGTITYQPPNVTGLSGQTASLYNPTYSKFVNDQSPNDTDPTDNFLTVNHTTNTTYSDVVVTCLLDYNEPTGQQAFDNAVQADGTFIFDELGLATYNSVTEQGMMLTHVVFHPIQKALNRRIQIEYVIRIVMT